MKRLLYISSGKKTLSDLTPSLTLAFKHLEEKRKDFRFQTHSLLKESLEMLDKKIKIFQPTIIVIFGQDTHLAFEYVKHINVPIGLWVVNDPYRISDYYDKAKQYDFIITEESSCVPFYKKQLNIYAFHFPLGVNEQNYYPIPNVNKRYDFSFIGNATPSRLSFFHSLLKTQHNHTYILVGKGWNQLRQYKLFKNQIKSVIMKPRDVCKIYNQSKIVLNLHRSDSDLNKNPYQLKALTPNNRTFDICAAKSFQLVSYREGLKDYFDLNKEIVSFHDASDLADKINYFKQNKKKRELIAKNGFIRTLQCHTYKQRVETLLNTLPDELNIIRPFQ
ncbi:glycosyltransferase [Halalkalibacter sp. AB-rgal2]|uniref:CgeB family protein n=1 Tax=Halalkalibacter sp. AB-rgal2 TaxID=3242695 RepID=UPI00359DEA9F